MSCSSTVVSEGLHEGFTQITKYELRELENAQGCEGLKGLEAKALKAVKALEEIKRHETLNTTKFRRQTTLS